MFIFCLLNNILYRTDYDDEGNYKYLEQENLREEKTSLQKEITKYDVHEISDSSMYLTIKTKLDIIELKEQYPTSSWQYRKMNDYMYDLIYQMNLYTYEKQEEVLAELKKEYTKRTDELKQDNWKYFLSLEKEKSEDEIADIQNELKVIVDKKEQEKLQELLLEKQNIAKVLEYRIKENIKEDDSYLNKAIEQYQEYAKLVKYYEDRNTKKTLEEKLEYRKAKSEMAINKYILENKININKQNNLNYQLRTIVEDYEIFIIIIIFMVAGTIVSDEFHSGTIKLLLIKPYSRCKILLSKYIACCFMIIFSIAFLILIQLLVGGVLFGFDSLSIPVVVYHYSTSSTIEYSVFIYMLIRILSKIPLLVMLLTICFGIAVFFTNTVTAIVVPLILYMFHSTIHYLAIQYHLKFMRYFISMNWNFQDYLFGGISDFPYVNFYFSVKVWLIYFAGVILLTFLAFQKKNIRNI